MPKLKKKVKRFPHYLGYDLAYLAKGYIVAFAYCYCHSCSFVDEFYWTYIFDVVDRSMYMYCKVLILMKIVES